MSAPLHTLGVADAARALRAKQVSSVELATHLLDRVAAQPALGAFLAVDREANQRSAPAVEDGLFLVPKVIE